jgi:zinc protease
MRDRSRTWLDIRTLVRIPNTKFLIPSCTVLIAALLGTACRGAAARDAETLPGRTRQLFDHNWRHPRDLEFPDNRFAPADPRSALVALSSGLRAYVIPDDGNRLVEITAAVPLGRGFEEANEIGAADLLSRLLTQQINDRLGAAFIGRVTMEQEVDLTRFTLRVLSEDWPSSIKAVIETLRQPRFEAGVVAAYRTGAGFARQTRGLGGPAFRPAIELARMLAGYPLAPPVPGLSVRREAVESIARRSLVPGVVAIGVGGAVAREDARRELESATGGWRSSDVRLKPDTTDNPVRLKPDATDKGVRFRAFEEPGYTTWLAVGHPMPKLSSADEAAVAVMTDILNIRLTIAIREIRGLANATQLQVPATIHHDGLLHVRSGARPESIAPILKFAVQELSRIREPAGAPTADELEQVKGGIVLGQWQGSLDGARTASATYAVETVRFGSVEHLINWPKAVMAVSADDVVTVARKYIHPDMLATVVIGQVEKVRQARHPRWPVALDDLVAARKR